MARSFRGDIDLAMGIKISANEPSDSRTLVPTVDDLYKQETWKENPVALGNPAPVGLYKGLLVTVQSDGSVWEYRGENQSQYSAKTSWVKVIGQNSSFELVDSPTVSISSSTSESGVTYTFSSPIKIKQITGNLPENVREAWELQDENGDTLGSRINIYKDSSLSSVTYNEQTEKLIFTYITDSGGTNVVEVDLNNLILESECQSGVTATGGIIHGVVDSSSESFLTVGGRGFKLSGVQNAINAAKSSANTYTDNEISDLNTEVTQKINGLSGNTVTEINKAVSECKGYTDDKIADLNTEVTQKINGLSGNTVTEINNAVSECKGYTDNEISQLNTEVTQKINGLSGNTVTEINNAVSESKAYTDGKIAGLDSSTATTSAGSYITAITITDGKIASVRSSTVSANETDVTISTSANNAAGSVIKSISAGGTNGHGLSAVTTTKISSAATADNAEKVGNYSPGNGSGNVPISNGTTNTNLNADMVDGYHISVVDSIPSSPNANTIYILR